MWILLSCQSCHFVRFFLVQKYKEYNKRSKFKKLATLILFEYLIKY